MCGVLFIIYPLCFLSHRAPYKGAPHSKREWGPLGTEARGRYKQRGEYRKGEHKVGRPFPPPPQRGGGHIPNKEKLGHASVETRSFFCFTLIRVTLF